MRPPRPLQKKKFFEKSGIFIIILVLNFCLFLLIGSQVIYHLAFQKLEDRPVFVKVKQPPPPPKPPAAQGGDSAKSLKDPADVVVPPTVSAPNIVVSANPSQINFTAANLPVITDSLPSFAAPQGAGLGAGTSGNPIPQNNPFGGKLADGSTPALVGYFYDLKQTNDNPPQPTGMDQPTWRKEMERLVADNLDENDLSKYLKSKDPRTTSGLAIPQQPSENAPQAFGMDNVQPYLWAVVYHATCAAPEDGRYRFVGFGDDLLYIKLNHKLVFDGGWQFLSDDSSLHQTYPYVWSKFVGDNGKLRKGAWFYVSKGDVIHLDVLIGDWGGSCGYFLMLEEAGNTYDKEPDGITPKLPLFQIGSKISLPQADDSNEVPPASESDSVWTPVTETQANQ